MTKKQFLKLAKKRGIKIIKNDISKARSLEELCGNLVAKYPYSYDELIEER